MADSLKKLQFLDSLRGIAILLVLLVHSAGTVDLFGSKLALANLGQRGVQLFYEISAFSLLYSHYSRREHSWTAFYIRRFFRIAPLFYLSIAANCVVSVVVMKGPALSLGAYASGVLFLFGFHPDTINAVAPAGWSIAVEMTFYALFPLLVACIKDLGTALAAAACSAAACFWFCHLSNFAAGSRLPAEYVQFLWFPAEFPVFCFGFVSFFLWRDLVLSDSDEPAFHRILSRLPARRAASLALLGVSALLIAASFPPNNYRLYPNSIGFIFLILALSIHPFQILVNPVTGWIGRLSFSIYLVHPYLRGLAGTIVDRLEKVLLLHLYGSYPGLAVAFAVFLLGSLILSLATHPLVELAGMSAGKRLVAKLAGRKRTPKTGAVTEASSLMETKNDAEHLRSKLRSAYALWILSLAASSLFFSLYHRHDPEKMEKSAVQYRAELARYQSQMDELSAEVLQNQRELRNAQTQLLQTAADYANAIETIKRLQARPQG